MKRKRTVSVVRKIRARRAQGVGFADLAQEFKLGLGTIHRACQDVADAKPAAPVAAPPAAATPAPPDDEPVPTREELLGYLAAQARTLRADAERAKDAPTRAAANRNLIAVQALITKLVPPSAQPNGVFVASDDMEAAMARGRQLQEGTVRGLIAWRATFSICNACGGHIKPADFNKQLNEHDASLAMRCFAQLL